jgi:DNA repair photolyase
MPILPFLTDTPAHLDEAMRRAKAAGATSVVYTALYLRPGVREWFMQWLEGAHPEHVERYKQLYARGAYAPKEYRSWLADRINPLIRAHGLQRGATSSATGGVAPPSARRAPAFAPAAAEPEPMLF